MGIKKTETIAMILAGGQGSRLGKLTKNLAKPAVNFGGKYRIIDFPLSNCSNSGIYNVGVLTQYQPLVLNTYIGIGSPWDLDRMNGGVRILPPYVSNEGGRWYRGTANAIYENIDFIKTYNPKYVLILSGDHIYKMDYSKVIKYHKQKKSQATIGVIKVDLKEASRFGIMNTKEDLSIYEFEEKPKQPKNDLASMGIYVFDWEILKKYLEEDDKDDESSNDFGKDIIPKMLNNNVRMYAYPFESYWKDVGTIDSLWQANMDLLDNENELDLYDASWKIYSVNSMNPPNYITNTGIVKNSLLNEGCIVEGEVYESVLFPGVHVGKNAVIKSSVIMPNAVIQEGAIVEKAIVASDYIVKKDSKIGNEKSQDIYLAAY